MLSKQDFYTLMEETTYGEENTLRHIVTGPNREESGFYELCCAFATTTNTTEYEIGTVAQKLKKIVCQFCDRHHIVHSDTFMELINRSYVKLLPPSIQDVQVENNDLVTGGLVGYFQYSPTIPSEIWNILYNDMDSIKEAKKYE